MNRVALFIATAGYAGLAPIAPGTAGSIVGLAIYVVLRWIGNDFVEAITILGSLALGIWSAGVVERQLGKDPGAVVIDEVAGMLITVAFLKLSAVGAVTAFILFRVYDVLKPYPAGSLEHLHGGPGIMLDDVMAGIYGHLTMRLLIAILPGVMT
jgi:phosphatidylglycerophosphatase A